MDRQELARITADPEMFRLAVRQAASRELAEDAIQETVRAIAERKNPDAIENLVGFFYAALIREIDHQLRRPAALLDPDITLTSDRNQYRTSLSAQQPVEGDVQLKILVEGYVTAPDWNAILKDAYPQWCDEPGLALDARDQRLSRARRDVQQLLRSVLSREELAS